MFFNAKVPSNWSFPSPYYDRVYKKYRTDGFIWRGKNPPHQEDFDALYSFYGDKAHVDVRTLVGKDDPSYTTFKEEMKQKRGGVVVNFRNMFRW